MADENVLFDELLDVADAAADALQVNTNAGKLTVEFKTKVWKDSVLTDVSGAEYKEAPANQKRMDIEMNVDIQELKPDLTFSLDRKCPYRKAEWFDNKKLGTTGFRTTLAQLFDVSGTASLSGKELADAMKDVSDKEIALKLRGISGKYVFASDVPNGKIYNDKPLKSIRIDRVFDSREEFMTAYTERFGASNAVAPQNSDVPAGWGSMEAFAADVRELRGDGMSNGDIATELGVATNIVIGVE